MIDNKVINHWYLASLSMYNLLIFYTLLMYKIYIIYYIITYTLFITLLIFYIHTYLPSNYKNK